MGTDELQVNILIDKLDFFIYVSSDEKRQIKTRMQLFTLQFAVNNCIISSILSFYSER